MPGVELPKRSSSCAADVREVLKTARESDLDEVVVIGIQKNGDFYHDVSNKYVPDILFMLECFKRALID